MESYYVPLFGFFKKNEMRWNNMDCITFHFNHCPPKFE